VGDGQRPWPRDFADPTALVTTVTFSAPGVYVLRLSANDSVSSTTDDVTVTVDRGTCLAPSAGLRAGGPATAAARTWPAAARP